LLSFAATVAFLALSANALADEATVPADPNDCDREVRSISDSAEADSDDSGTLIRFALDNSREVSRLESLRATPLAYPPQIADPARSRLDLGFKVLKETPPNCGTQDGLEAFSQRIDSIKADVQLMSRLQFEQPKEAAGKLDDLLERFKDRARLCRDFAAPATGPRDELINAVYDYWGYSDQLAIDQFKEHEAQQKCAVRLIDARAKRAHANEATLSELVSRGRFITSFPWMMALFFGGVSTLVLLIRRFETEIQAEWVRSGQVVQFASATLLIIVVFALALSGRIESQSIGTLLGALSGYILSQGVGGKKDTK